MSLLLAKEQTGSVPVFQGGVSNCLPLNALVAGYTLFALEAERKHRKSRVLSGHVGHMDRVW